jgi:AmiR/NasT family two-component response regulator
LRRERAVSSERSRRAIVCEDEPLTSSSLAKHLEELGYEVAARPRDGLEAVAAAVAHEPELVLMDIRMPELDGLEAARRILEKLTTTIVVITAYVTDEFVDRAARVGVAGYLVKPVSFDQLRVAVQVATEGVRRLDQARANAELATRRLADRKVIERAKGILMEYRGYSEQEAYRTLQKRSQNERRPMAELAQEIVEAHEALGKGDSGEGPASG